MTTESSEFPSPVDLGSLISELADSPTATAVEQVAGLVAQAVLGGDTQNLGTLSAALERQSEPVKKMAGKWLKP